MQDFELNSARNGEHCMCVRAINTKVTRDLPAGIDSSVPLQIQHLGLIWVTM